MHKKRKMTIRNVEEEEYRCFVLRIPTPDDFYPNYPDGTVEVDGTEQ